MELSMTARLVRQDCLVLLIDLQERLVPVIEGNSRIVARCRLLAAAARALAVPLLVSEQYPQGLGPTVAALQRELGDAPRFAKMDFSCAAVPAIVDAVRARGRRTLVLAGVEAHVCVLQTALGFRELGFSVALVADATGSRREESRALALERARAAGCALVDTEMVLFEWLERAGTPEFKLLAPWIREGAPP